MKIIDLLNKIANGEEVPRKFTYKGYLWEYDVKNKMWFYYFGESKSHRFDRLFYLNLSLNDEVEILEEEKKLPEKINKNYNIRILDLDKPYRIKDYDMEQLIEMVQDIYEKQGEICDYLKSKGE